MFGKVLRLFLAQNIHQKTSLVAFVQSQPPQQESLRQRPHLARCFGYLLSLSYYNRTVQTNGECVLNG